MAEPKRLQFTTVEEQKDDKPKKKTPETLRLIVTLGASTDLTCPEYFYTDLVKKTKGEKKAKGSSSVSEDPFGDDEDHDKLAALAKSFEEKYGSNSSSKKNRKNKAGRLEDLFDLGKGYDEADPFIDNSEAYDEVVPASLTTKLGGFYINSGRLEFKDAVEDSGDEFIHTNKKHKKKRVISDSDSDGEDKEKKKRKLKDSTEGEECNKKKKKLLNGDGPMSFKKPVDKDKMAKKKKMSPKVAELLKLQTESTSTPVSHANGNSADLDMFNLTNDDSSQEVKSFDERIDSVIDSVIDMSRDDKKMDSILDSAIALHKDDSNSKDLDEAKVIDESSVPKIPSNMPKELKETIIKLKEVVMYWKKSNTLSADLLAGKSSRDGKCKFFTNEVNKMLLDIEVGTRKLGSSSQRSSIYSHLAAFLPCGKDTLLKRAKKLQQSQQDDQLKEPIQKLREAINGMMPSIQEKYEAECQKMKQQEGEKEEQQKDAQDTEDSEEEKSSEPNKKGPKGPRKKFEWTESIRSLLCEIVRIKMKSFDLIKTRTQTAEEFLKAFLDREIKPLWPKGWMQTRTLFKECRAAHSQWTNPQKPKKPANIVLNKPVSTPTNAGAAVQTPPITPKFSPGSTPVHPTIFDDTSLGSKEKLLSPSVASRQGVPTLLDYAGDCSAVKSNTTQSNSVTDTSTSAAAASGLSLLASSAASQKYMDKSWNHVVSDILRSSLLPHSDEVNQKDSNLKTEDGDGQSSFLDQFQKYAASQFQKQLKEGDSRKSVHLPQSEKPQSALNKRSDLLVQTKTPSQQQILKKLQSATQQMKANSSPSGVQQQGKSVLSQNSAKPKQEVKIVTMAPPAQQSKVNVVSMSSTTGQKTSLLPEDVYKKFLLESGVKIPQGHSKSPTNAAVHSVTGGGQKTLSMQSLPSSNGQMVSNKMSKTVYVHTTGSGNSQKVASVLSHDLVSSHQSSQNSGNAIRTFQSNSNMQRSAHSTLSHGSGSLPLTVQRSVNQGSLQNNPASLKNTTAPATELLQQLFGQTEGQTSLLHSQPKRSSPQSGQNKSVSPSSLYSKSATSPAPRKSPQSSLWSVASIAQGNSQKAAPGSTAFSMPHNLPKQPQGYQNLKLSGVNKDVSLVNTALSKSSSSMSLPSPEILSPAVLSFPTNPLLPGQPMLPRHPGQSSPLSHPPGMYPPFTSSPLHHPLHYGHYPGMYPPFTSSPLHHPLHYGHYPGTDRSRSPHGY